MKAKAEFAVALISLAALCTYAAAQENTAEDWFNKSQELFRNHSYEYANKSIDLISVNSTQKLAGAWEQKAFALANLGDMMRQDQALYEESVSAYDRAIELDPRRVSARTGKAAVLATRLNRTDDALEASSSAVDLSIDLNSNNSNDTSDEEEQIRALEVQGLSLAKAGKYEEATATYDRLLEIAPQNSYAMSFAWQGKGNALFGMKRYEEAISAYDRAVETYPSSMDKLFSQQASGRGRAMPWRLWAGMRMLLRLMTRL